MTGRRARCRRGLFHESEGWHDVANRARRFSMLRNTVRGILGLVFVAAATWLANYLTELLFGPENSSTSA
jgi:hypothetical protein